MKRKIFMLTLLLISIMSFSQNKVDTLKVINLTNVEVTGVRSGVKTPISQKTISSNDIYDQYYGQEMIYIIGNSPSVGTQSDGGHLNGYTYFSIRGIDQTRINVTLNGCQLNESEDQGVYFSNYPGFAMNIKSMQIQRGIGTTSNGTASYGGSINFESKYGLDKGLNINVSNGSFSTKTFNLSYSSGLIKNKYSFYANISDYGSDGYRYHSGGTGYSGFISGAYFNNYDIVKITAFTGGSKNKMAWMASPLDSIKIDPRNNPLESDDKDDFTQSFVQLQHIHGFKDKDFVLTNTVYYNRLDGVYDVYNDYIKLGSNFVGFTSNYLLNVDNLKINTGFHLNSYNRTHSGTNNGEYYSNIGYKREGSVYLKMNYDVKKFNIFGDLQLRNVDFSYNGNKPMPRQNWLFLNPRAGVTYTINKNENFYGSVGQTHREPTRTNMFGGMDNLDSLYNITPESVIDYEIGYNFNNDLITYQTNLFYMDFKNEITLAGAPSSNSLPTTTSVDKSFRTGIESDITYTITENFKTSNISSLMYSQFYMNNNEISRTPLYSPVVLISQGVTYNIKKIVFDLNGQYSSSAFIDLTNTSKLPNYFLLNVKIGYQINKNINISVFGNNLTNTRYYTSGYVDGDGNKCFFIGTPINFMTTLKIKL